jgi:DsbC/DsbD-like thiol-disulfide interchange protein
MNKSNITRGLIALASFAASMAAAQAPDRSLIKTQAVEYLFPEQVTIPAGKSSPVALHFRIAPGLHINSHAPKEEFLIPTTFSIPDSTGVHLDSASYPVGKDFTLPLDPSEKLSVYTGEFSIEARIVSPPGEHLVEAKLHYQACDNNACMPPKTITVAFDVIGK